MGDSEEGGGGSVQWKLEANNANGNHEQNGNKVKQKGKDNDGGEGTDFTVSFLRHPFNTAAEFLAHLKSPQGLKLSTKDTDRVYFNLPIKKNTPAQIRVSWGDSNHHEGTGGQQTMPLLGATRRVRKKKVARKR